jgi:hypothetical protein
MKNYFLISLVMIISSLSYPQTINGRLGEFETEVNQFDSTLFITLQIKLNENESAILGRAHNVKLTFNSQALKYIDGQFLNFNETQGYSPTLIFNPGQSPTIHIETELATGTGTEVTDSYIDFVRIQFTIIDFGQDIEVCPKNNTYLFYSPGSHTAWLMGEWLCYESSIPVELTSFTGSSNNGNIVITWTTATEMNNKGFEVEKFLGDWQMIGYVPGFGTTTEPKLYSFTDINVTNKKHIYRLKQVDYDGSFKYSDEVVVQTDFTPGDYFISQNYPNPFNPSTTISYTLPIAGEVTLKVYDILGNEITTLVKGFKMAGKYDVDFNASSLPSGFYFYQLKAGSFFETNKMLLIK